MYFKAVDGDGNVDCSYEETTVYVSPFLHFPGPSSLEVGDAIACLGYYFRSLGAYLCKSSPGWFFRRCVSLITFAARCLPYLVRGIGPSNLWGELMKRYIPITPEVISCVFWGVIPISSLKCVQINSNNLIAIECYYKLDN